MWSDLKDERQRPKVLTSEGTLVWNKCPKLERNKNKITDLLGQKLNLMEAYFARDKCYK